MLNKSRKIFPAISIINIKTKTYNWINKIKTIIKIQKIQKNHTSKLKSWIDPRLEARNSPIQGKGIFTKSSIKKGEKIMIWAGKVVIQAKKNKSIAIDEGLYLGGSIKDYPDKYSQDKHPLNKHDLSLSACINHSCNSNIWMDNEITFSAKKNIKANEELTIDYAMISVDPEWSITKCNCNSKFCRGIWKGDDYKKPELQKRYKNHFSPFLNKKIEKLKTLLLKS